jgi:aspartyl-tRNA synthetase
VVCIKGKLRMRKDPNPKIPTGLLELLAEDIKVGGASAADADPRP